MGTRKTAILNERRLGATKMNDNNLIVKPKTTLCYNCRKNLISPYEIGLCDFCSDDLRYTPRTI